MAYDVAAGGQSVGLAKTQVHPLNELFLEMKEKLTNEDLKTILNLSKRRLDIKPGEDLEWQDYFNKLQETFAGDWESILEFLKEVFLAYDRHINDGTDKLTHVIENCEKKIRDEIRRIESYGIIKDKQFVGRTKEIEKITEFLSRPSSYIKGVCICGMAGMGKTSMASEICFNAKEVTTRRCLRGKKNLSEFYSEILRALMTNTEDSEFYDSNTRTEDVLKEAVHQKLSEIKTDIILFLDNIDDISDSSEHRFSDAVEELLNIKTEPEVKLLMTTRQKLRMIEEAPLKSVFVERFGRKLLEVELRSLEEDDAKKLLWCYAGEDFEAGKCDARIRQIQMDMEGHSSGSEKMSDNDEDNEELEDYSESDDSDGHVEVGGGQVVVGGGQVEVGGGQLVIGGGRVEVAGGQVEVAGGQVEVGAAGGEEARVGRHLSRLDSGVEIEDDEDEIFA